MELAAPSCNLAVPRRAKSPGMKLCYDHLEATEIRPPQVNQAVTAADEYLDQPVTVFTANSCNRRFGARFTASSAVHVSGLA